MEEGLIEANTPLIKNCYFSIGNMVFKQYIGKSLGIEPATFWGNPFLYFFKFKHVQNLIFKRSTRAYKHHASSRCINDFCTINDDGEWSKSFKCIYPGKLELILEHSERFSIF